jgi:hypothetical protein
MMSPLAEVALFCIVQPLRLFVGLWCNLVRARQQVPGAHSLLRRQHRIPDRGRTFVFDAQSTEVELTLLDPA